MRARSKNSIKAVIPLWRSHGLFCILMMGCMELCLLAYLLA